MAIFTEMEIYMSLNVKDPEAHRLAQAISRATGESMTRVVTEALREHYTKIERRRGKANVQELLTIADRAAVHVRRPYVDHGELLYDENGLPK
jgi:antitoxin VapB